MGIIDGKKISSRIEKDICEEVQALKQKTGKTPGLAAVLVGGDPASAVYVRKKNKTCNDFVCRIRNSNASIFAKYTETFAESWG